MATRYRFGDNEKPHFITYSVVNWIDIFSREMYVEILLESLRFLDYLHENPVKAGYVWEAQHYKYSSAIDYYTEGKGLLPIEYL